MRFLPFMQIRKLHSEFDRLQKKFGNRNLNAIYGAGCVKKPAVCFIFMNPTGRNVASNKKWNGLRAPWLGTKNVWKLFYEAGLLKKELYNLTQKKNSEDWDTAFANTLYREIKNNGIYITNLSKATQQDAKPLKNQVFKEYLPLIRQEISILKPKIVISFGNQVSSIILNQPVKVSECRKKHFLLGIAGKSFPVYPAHYPVGQGMRNLAKTVNDIKWILNKHAQKL
jgi:hypothetical protein